MSLMTLRPLVGFACGLACGLFCVTSLAREKPSDDPEILLMQAQQEMREMQARHREAAVQAITQKNMLVVEHANALAKLTQRRAEENDARRAGDVQAADSLARECDGIELDTAALNERVALATEKVDEIKTLLRQEEHRIRLKTAEAMALRVKWQGVQVNYELDPQEAARAAERADELMDRARVLIEEAEARRRLNRNNRAGSVDES